MSTLKERSQAILDEKNAKILPENIKKDVQIFDITGTLEEGIDTSDATASANDLPQDKTAYVNGEKITGTILEVPENTTSGGIDMEYTWYGQWAEDTSTLECKFEEDRLQRAGSVISIPIMNPYMENNVVDKMGVKAEKIVKGQTIMGVTGTADAGAKIFETVDDMNNDTTSTLDDLAIVYREEIQNATVDSKFSVATFPSTVVLPDAITDYVEIMYRAVDDSVTFDCWGQLSSTDFTMSCYSDAGETRIQYTSEDGITYTRTDGGDETIDFGTEIYFYYTDYWNDALGYFIQPSGKFFEGLYQYDDHVLNSMGAFGIAVSNNEITNVPLDDVSISVSILEDITQQIKTLRSLTSVSLTVLLDSNKTDLIIVACTYTYDPYVANCPYIIYNDAQYLPTYHRAYKEVVHYKYNLETNTLSEYEPDIENEVSLQYYNSDGYVLKGIPFDGYLVCMTYEGKPHNINAYTWVGGTTYAEYTSKTIECDYQYIGKYFVAPTQFDAIAETVMLEKSFFGKNGIETGTLTGDIKTVNGFTNSLNVYNNTYNINIEDNIDLSSAMVSSNIVYVPNMNILTSEKIGGLFNKCSNMLLSGTLNAPEALTANAVYSQCTSLVTAPEILLPKATITRHLLSYCSNLVNVPVYDFPNATNVDNMFYSDTSLSDESLNNIMQTCINLVAFTALGTNLTLKYIGLTEEQATKCMSLSNYQTLVDAGWTTGY